MTERSYTVLVGDGRVAVSASEYAAANATRGQTIWFRHRLDDNLLFGRSKELSKWKRGTFIGAMFYDGVMASVYEDDPDDYIVHKLLCDHSFHDGEEVFRLEPPEPVRVDIVNRLGEECDEQTFIGHADLAALLSTAADEIRRLRALITEWSDALCDLGGEKADPEVYRLTFNRYNLAADALVEEARRG